jgi:peptidoglycan/LPS O-acetylase OafA/YrhL
MRRLPQLDGLRTIAIALVLLYHLSFPLTRGGFLGVDIFLALSGYLVTSLLMKEHERNGRIALGKFWIRRAIRFYPALIAVTIAAFFTWPLISRPGEIDASSAAAIALTYTGNVAIAFFR